MSLILDKVGFKKSRNYNYFQFYKKVPKKGCTYYLNGLLRRLRKVVYEEGLKDVALLNPNCAFFSKNDLAF